VAAGGRRHKDAKNGGRDWDRTSDPCDVNAKEEAENQWQMLRL